MAKSAYEERILFCRIIFLTLRVKRALRARRRRIMRVREGAELRIQNSKFKIASEREQNQTCLNYAERKQLKATLVVG